MILLRNQIAVVLLAFPALSIVVAVSSVVRRYYI